MTATAVLEIVEQMEARCSFARLQSQILISPSAADLVGTTAQLLKEDMLTVEELIYGMMLPSGNDAAESLAMYFGSLLLTQGKLSPNIHLVEISEQLILDRIDGYRNGTYPPKVNKNETVDQKRKRCMEQYDNWQQTFYYEESKSSEEKFAASSSERNQSTQGSPSPDENIKLSKILKSEVNSFQIESDSSSSLDLQTQRNASEQPDQRLKTFSQDNNWELNSDGQQSEEEEKMSGAVDYSEMRFVDLKRKVVFELVREREREALKAFYKRMNETSVRLGCSKKTNFAVAHGMHHDRNYSTALDIATLSCNAIRNHPLLADVINTKYYECRSRLLPDHCYKWKNTNEMIWDSSKCYYGVKTGVTQTAGPCLSVHYKSQCGTFDFIIVVLNSKTKEARFLEIPKLVEWAIQKIQRVKKINYKPSLKRQLLRNLAHF